MEAAISNVSTADTRSTVARSPFEAGGQPARQTKGPLIPLLIAAIIPVLLFAGWITYRAAEQNSIDSQSAAVTTVERIVERVRAEMMAQIQVAQTLALSAALDSSELTTFYREARRLKDTRQLWFTVEIDDLAGMQIMNLLRPLGAALGPTADRASFDEVVRSKKPVIGGIGPLGPISGQKLVTLRVPVIRGDTLTYILSVAFDPTAINSILGQAGIPKDWIGTVVDGAGNIIARSGAENETLGRPAGPAAQTASLNAERGRYPGRSSGGVDLEVVYQAVSGIGGWSVHAGIPTSKLNAPIHRSLYALAGGVAASLALAGLLAVFVNRDVARQREIEAEHAQAALTASERQGALAIEAADLGTWRWSVADGMYSGSERTQSLLRLSADAAGPPLWNANSFWHLARLDERGDLQQAIRSSLDRSESFEIDLPIASGPQARWLRVRGRAAGDDGERIVIGVLADITVEKRAEADRFDLVKRLADAQDQVQARIARELHDQVGQTVTGLSLGLKSLERVLDARQDTITLGDYENDIREKLRWLQTLANDVGREIHQVASDLRPTALDDLGLAKALEAHITDWSRRFNVEADCQFVGLDADRLPRDVETAAYRCAQEALTNVIKHAQAQTVSVVVERRLGELRLVIEDDGSGFRPAAAGTHSEAAEERSSHLGLSGMRERLVLLGGQLRIESVPSEGTSVFIRIPLAEGASGHWPS